MKIFLRLSITIASIAFVVICLAVFSFRDRRPNIFFAAESGDTNYIEKYLASGANLNNPVVCYRFGNRFSPLLNIAVSNAQSNTVAFLLQHGANPNLPDSQGETALMEAVSTGSATQDDSFLTITTMLLKAGADPNYKNALVYDYTPLSQASSLGRAKLVEILLAAGANVNATNSAGQTALHLAKSAEVAKLLVVAGADLSSRANGETPAEAAGRDHRYDVLVVLSNAVTEHLNRH